MRAWVKTMRWGEVLAPIMLVALLAGIVTGCAAENQEPRFYGPDTLDDRVTEVSLSSARTDQLGHDPRTGKYLEAKPNSKSYWIAAPIPQYILEDGAVEKERSYLYPLMQEERLVALQKICLWEDVENCGSYPELIPDDFGRYEAAVVARTPLAVVTIGERTWLVGADGSGVLASCLDILSQDSTSAMAAVEAPQEIRAVLDQLEFSQPDSIREFAIED